MRAIRRLILAPIILAAVTSIAGGPTHQACPVPQAASLLAAQACPAGSNWDNVLHRCV